MKKYLLVLVLVLFCFNVFAEDGFVTCIKCGKAAFYTGKTYEKDGMYYVEYKCENGHEYFEILRKNNMGERRRKMEKEKGRIPERERRGKELPKGKK